jgi:16S rRNA (adenine1518-N6/adenine1519-N6)-dimethyltransferase
MGQNFLVDRAAAERIADEVLAVPARWILEIGAGTGNLTDRLMRGPSRVVALERDRRLARLCAERFAGRDGLTIVAGDALGLPFKRILPEDTLSVAGNIPYSITGEIVRRVGEELVSVRRAVLLVQREAAQRMAARTGGDGYGAFTILTRAKWTVDVRFTVPAASFYPRPDVDSALVVLERPDSPAVKPALYPLVRRLVHEAFQRRRKTLANAIGPFHEMLRASGDVSHVILAAGLEPQQRPETVDIEGWVLMAQALRGVIR